MHMRVLLFRVFFVIPVYSFFKGRLRVGEMKKCLGWHFEYCARRVPTLRSERNTQNKTSSLTPFACLSMFRLPKPYCALRSQHLLSQMHSLSIIPELYSGTFPKKVLLLRFPFPCTYPIPLGLKTKEEPRMNQGTPKERPTTQKCFLLRLATSKKSLLRQHRLSASPAKCLCQFPLHPFVKFLYTLAQVPKCHIADNQHLSYFGTPFEQYIAEQNQSIC